jgi:hypothetical protein
MSPTNRAAGVRRIVALGAGVAFLVLIAPLVGQQPSKPDLKPAENEPSVQPGKKSNEPLPIYAHFRDGSRLKLTMREERVEMVTPYGRLVIPVTDIRRIDFGLHTDAATAKRVAAAIAGLGSADSKERDTAAAEVLDLGEHAYPALVEATKSKDTEVAQRADAMVNKLRERIPPDLLERPATDTVETVDCKVTGRISAEIFKVKTSQFGDQQVRLGDLASLGSKQFLDPEAFVTDQHPPFGGGPNWGVPGGVGPGGFQPGGGRRIRGQPGPGGINGQGGAAPGGVLPSRPRGAGDAAPEDGAVPGGNTPPPKPPGP